jgi:actin-related protein 2
MSDLLFNTIQEAAIDLRPQVVWRVCPDAFRRTDCGVCLQFYKSIMLSGGSTMYPGLPTRLETDIRNRYLNEIVKGARCGLGMLEGSC